MRHNEEGKPTWQHQPLDLTARVAGLEGTVCSPSGRPYSPYPYRDLLDTAKETPATPTLLTGTKESFFDDGRTFSRFGYLPTELRLQIWREVVLAACERGRVHRVRLAIASSPGGDSRLELVASARLADSTFATRSLLSTCHESRQEALSYLRIVPDTLPLQGGGIFHCDLAQDIIMLEDLSPALLLQIHHLQCLSASLSPIRHLGLDLSTTAHLQGFLTRHGMPPNLATAFVTLVSALPNLEQIYLLQPTATLTAPLQNLTPSSPPEPPQDPITIFDWYASVTTPSHDRFFRGVNNPSPTTTTSRNVHMPVNYIYTTRPAPSYWVDEAYYTHLAQLMRLVCEMRMALDMPPAVVVTQEQEEEGGLLERLAGVRLRVLRHYVFGDVDVEGGVAPLELSSPERCLEVGLGGEERGVQWEWVCQCLEI